MIERHAVRAILLTPHNELLLINIVEPKSKSCFWITPGGGIDQGETPAATLRREVFEETGLSKFEVGPLVWHRKHNFSWDGKAFLQHEQYFLVKVDRFAPTKRFLPNDIERDVIAGFRWWQPGDIEKSGEDFAPRHLGRLINSLLSHGPPATPIDVSDPRA